MKPLETVHAAIMALRDHKLRSALTALGIIIGTSATIAMLAIGAGARAQVAAQVQSLGSNLWWLFPAMLVSRVSNLVRVRRQHSRMRMLLQSRRKFHQSK